MLTLLERLKSRSHTSQDHLAVSPASIPRRGSYGLLHALASRLRRLPSSAHSGGGASSDDAERVTALGSSGRGQALGGADGARGMHRRSKSLSDYPAPAPPAAKAYGLVGSRSVGGGLSSARWPVAAATDLFTLVTPPGGTPCAGGSPGLSPTVTTDISALSSRRESGTSGTGEVGDGGDGGAVGGGGSAAGGVRRLLSRKLSGNQLVISTEAQTARPGEQLLPEGVACFAGNTLAELGGEMELLVQFSGKSARAARAGAPSRRPPSDVPDFAALRAGGAHAAAASGSARVEGGAVA
ncbi:hypothetical protein WJX81_002883 [Elliptochloris bilobata]|uniref:Uncharacterized protein n=1 Tax=Elliptochloris bilobata TaxID=381761 RepID=A0AAW1S8I6_9CHLO